jgi:hypothetical protein
MVSFIQLLLLQLQITTMLENLTALLFHKFDFVYLCSDLCLYSEILYYLMEMIGKIVQEDRIPVLKASQDHLKVIKICHVTLFH